MFQNWCVGHGYERAAELIDENWEQMVTFYQFPRGHWRHLRTTNVVESPFAALRLRTDAAKRFKKVANATAVVWKMLLVAERKFRRSNSPELLPAVAAGQQYHDGLPIRGGQHQETPPDLFTHLLTEPLQVGLTPQGKSNFMLRPACLLPAFRGSFRLAGFRHPALGHRGFHLSPGACYPVLRRLPGRDDLSPV